MIQIKNLTKVYRTKSHRNFKALKNLNLVLPSKGLVLLCGKSGSGKTTLLNILGGLDYQTEGEILVDGKPLLKKNLDGYRNNYSSFVFQQLNLIDDLTVEENMDVCFDLMGMKKDKAKIVEALSHVRLPDDGTDLDDFLSRRPDELSGGQKQRVAIARGLLKNPRVLILDEPSASLDKENAIVLGELLKKISKDCLVILSSHNLDVYSDYADMIVRMEQGKIVETRKIGEAIEDGGKGIVSDRKGHLSLTSSFKLILRSISRKKVRFFATFFLGILALFCFSFGYQIVSTPTEEAKLVAQHESGNKTMFLEAHGIRKDNDNSFCFKDDSIFKKNNVKYWPVIKISEENALYGRYNVNMNKEYNYLIDIQQFAIEIDDSFPYLKRYQKLKPETKCRYPVGKDEIAISDFYAQCLFYNPDNFEFSETNQVNKKLDCIDDIIGYTYYGYRIVGIFEGTDNSASEIMNKHPFLIEEGANNTFTDDEELYIRQDLISKYIFVSSDFDGDYDDNQYSDKVLFELGRNANYDMKLIKQIMNQMKDDDRGYKLLGAASYCINKYSKLDNFFYYQTILSYSFCIILLIFHFATTLLFYLLIVKDLDHNFGVLKALGCSKGGIIKIIFCLFCVMSVLELAITIFSIFAFDLFVDYFYLGFSILRIKADYLLVTIGLILLFGLVSSICSSYKALKGSPTNVINGY